MPLKEINSAICPPAQLAKRDLFLRRCKHIRMGWKVNLTNAHIWSRVPVLQIAFFFNVKRHNVERWIKATHRRAPLGWNKWRTELDLYEIAGVDFEKDLA